MRGKRLISNWLTSMLRLCMRGFPPLQDDLDATEDSQFEANRRNVSHSGMQSAIEHYLEETAYRGPEVCAGTMPLSVGWVWIGGLMKPIDVLCRFGVDSMVRAWNGLFVQLRRPVASSQAFVGFGWAGVVEGVDGPCASVDALEYVPWLVG